LTAAARMADPVYNVVQLDDGSITVDAPASAFPEKGYFTLYDKSAAAKGEYPAIWRVCAGAFSAVARVRLPREGCDPPCRICRN